MTQEEYQKSWATQYIPQEVAEMQEKIIRQAQKDGYDIGKADAMKIIAKSYKLK